LAQEGQSKDHPGKTVVAGAAKMGFRDDPHNSAPFGPLLLLHNPPRHVGAGCDRFDSSASENA
jgi:hypothetical protein